MKWLKELKSTLALTFVIVLISLVLTGCNTIPVQEKPIVQPVPPELFVLPERPVAGEITSQRDVAKFILDLSAYSKHLEIVIEQVKKHLYGAPNDGK